MNGAKSLVETLLANGIDTCFANPGTSEMHFVAALDQTPGMRCVLGLQENVVTGMADGYWRMARRPASTLLHCGPGLANGFANLHNARRAQSGIVNIVGDHATYHRPYDPPLAADTESLARSVSAWVRTTDQARHVGRDAAACVQAARTSPGQIATLILPSNVSWDEGGIVAADLPPPAVPSVDAAAVDQAARLLRDRAKVLLLLAGDAVTVEGQGLAWDIAQASGARLMVDYVNGTIARGSGRVPLERMPYSTDLALEALAPFEHIMLVGAKAPVAFFAYPGKPSAQYASTTQIHVLSRPEQDAVAALRALAGQLGAKRAPIPSPGERPSIASGAPTPERLAQTVAALLPENAIVVDESVSFGRGFYRHTHAAAPSDWLHLTGGAIGAGLPMATGAAIAAGGRRRVLTLQADGSAMYTLQALWTQARENLPCTTVLLSNRKYNILIGEYKAVGAAPGPTAMQMLDLGNPDLDWVKLATGMGVEAARAETMEQCAELMASSFRREGPFLVELVV
ncbi:acetolactate synthase-1/2/3 large subunit [Noviherbaspirillum humi]|uniref:Acetolactate synthase-1/2/3 large subunit n=1 Tax=Noviherbaspirillum humi TaxID=1688639 RepID=A0A239EUP6_9BURK|nr:acetolactate synthase large subunit [Noviherbaspirillum humi]SNS48131.1 acetolactate synthase-1/2/3 large subunit [Noviherbaspirillum humi]